MYGSVGGSTVTTTSTAGEPAVPDEPRGGASTWYEVLELAPSATPAEVQRAYDRALALIEGRSIGGYFLLDPLAVESVRADIEAAFAVLKDPAKRATYDARIGNAATLVPQAAQATRSDEQPPIGSQEGDDVTASDARALLGLKSTPSGEGVFAPLSPEARVAAAAAADAKAEALAISSRPPSSSPSSSPSSKPGEKPEEKATPSGKPRAAGLKFLSPVDDKKGRPKPAISFAPPKTDETTSTPTTSTAPAAPIQGGSAPPVAASAVSPSTAPTPTTASSSELPSSPASSAEPELQATLTVLPTAVMPAPKPSPATSPATSPSTTSSSNLPVMMTPQPMPGLFALEGQEVNGQLLKRMREGRGLSLEAMVEATKIRKPYLVAIEEQDLENLPARVFLRGFLTQIARVLRVDKVKLTEGYLAFVARYGK